MDIEKDSLKKQIREMTQLGYIAPEDLPSIELYMDQVTTFMDKYLSQNKRYEEDADENDDQQLYEEQSAPAAREEAVYEGTSDFADLYLLSEECGFNQRYSDYAETAD